MRQLLRASTTWAGPAPAVSPSPRIRRIPRSTGAHGHGGPTDGDATTWRDRDDPRGVQRRQRDQDRIQNPALGDVESQDNLRGERETVARCLQRRKLAATARPGGCKGPVHPIGARRRTRGLARLRARGRQSAGLPSAPVSRVSPGAAPLLETSRVVDHPAPDESSGQYHARPGAQREPRLKNRMCNVIERMHSCRLRKSGCPSRARRC